MDNTAILLWGILFSAIGLGFFVYGRRQRMVVPLFAGVGLLAFPYFVTNVYVMVAVGVGLMAIPYFIRV